MIEQVISHINDKLKPLFEKYTGSKVFGLAENVVGVKGQTRFPAIFDSSGEGKYVGVDDGSPIIIYHKVNQINSSEQPRGSTGDVRALQVNIYSNTIVVYLDRAKTKFRPDELYLFIQPSFPETISLNPFTISLFFTSVNLNGTQVFSSEYGADFNLPAEKRLFAINYTVQCTFKKGCFDKCP